MTMHAFGPYRDKVFVDFKLLTERGLFAITGPTGAGKTTIFDAICFALFGEASGENRNDQAFLRSHFADDEVYTSVELLFELKGKEFIIFRQKGHQKKQNKGVTGDKIEFYKMENDEQVPYCQEFNKTTVVNKKIEELLGINADQFKQIVLLPQGEFRKLLVSETKEKEEILRKIFKTESYDKVKDAIGTAKSIVESQFKKLKQTILIKLEVIEELLNENGIPVNDDSQINIYKVVEVLKDYFVKIDTDITDISEKEKIYKDQLEIQQQKLFAAEAHNKNINRLLEISELRSLLIEEESEMNKKRNKLLSAKKAEKVLPFKNELDKLLKSFETSNEKLKFEQELLNEICIQLDRISIEISTLPEKNKELANLELNYSNILSIKDLIEGYKTMKDHYSSILQKLAKCENEESLLKERLFNETEEMNKLKSASKQYDGIYEKWNQLSVLKQQIHQKGVFVKKIVLSKNDLKTKKDSYNELDNQFHILSNKLSVFENAILQQKAAVIAKELTENKECPVCGSIHHPSPAKFTGEINENEYSSLKDEVASLQNKLATSSGIIQSLEKSIQIDEQTYIDEYGHFEFTKDSLYTLSIEFKQIENDLHSSSEQKALLEKIQDEMKKKENEIEKLTSLINEKSKEVNDYKVVSNELNLKMIQAESKLPSNIETFDQWKIEKQQFEEKITALKSQINRIEEQNKSLNEQKTIKETTCKHLESEIVRMTAEKEITLNNYIAKLNENQFEDENQFLASVRDVELIEALSQEITRYDETIQRLQTEKDILEKQVSSFEKIDDASLREELEQIKLQNEKIINEIVQLQESKKRMIQLEIDLEAYYAEFVKTEQKHAKLDKLYRVTRGDNDKMISFERYVLLDYFEQIIESANIRLDHLSNGQFQLQRKDSVEKGRKQSGLGLEVYDSYTGLARDVKTLSGGEQFNASLCLALGMADIIQAHQGGVSIDTLFIDEGFGSLDEELLSKAIDTLIQLQKSGRLIGVISHVQEVKDAMPAVIEVHKTKHGYSELSIIFK